uniref:Uncharacterized protein n=1 Tax=Ailuropoda melanoleuca TaxID=9646 RepID=A0A7N5JMZ2_AILME
MVFKLAQAYYDMTRRQNFQASEQNQKKDAYHTQDEDDDIGEDRVQEKEERIRKSRRGGKGYEQTSDSSRHARSHESQVADGEHSESGSTHHQSSTRAHRSRQSQSGHGRSSSEIRPAKKAGPRISQDSDNEVHSKYLERRFESGSGNQHGSNHGHAGNRQLRSPYGDTYSKGHTESFHSYKHSGTEYGQHSSRTRGSSVSQDSDSEGQSEYSGNDSRGAHKKTGSTSRNQHGSNHGTLKSYFFFFLKSHLRGTEITG